MPAAEITIGQAFLPLFYNREPVVLVEGNRGCGKTRAILSVILCRALEFPGSTWALWRSTRTRLTDTVMKTLETQVFPAFGLAVPGGGGAENRSHYRLPNGSSLVPIGLDDIYRSTSAEFSGGYLNEGIEIAQLEQAQALLGALREDKVPFNQLIIDTNPGPPGHWLNHKAEYIPNTLRDLPADRADYDRLQAHNAAPAAEPLSKWKRILAGHEDNPGYFDLERWEYTPLGTRYIKNTLEGLDGHLRARWLHRRWAAAHGQVYPRFSETDNIIEPFKIPPWWPLYWGTDPGFDHPCAILWFTVTPTEQIIVIAEKIESSKGVDEHAASVRKVEEENGWTGRQITRYGDPQHAFSATAQSKKTIAEQWSDEGFTLFPWPRTGDNMDGMVDGVRKLINAKKLLFFNTCPVSASAHQSWSFARNADGSIKDGVQGKDKYEEEHKDPCDVVRGVVAAKPRYKVAAFSHGREE